MKIRILPSGDGTGFDLVIDTFDDRRDMVVLQEFRRLAKGNEIQVLFDPSEEDSFFTSHLIIRIANKF